MTGGESSVGNSDIDSLVLDFMRALAAQHSLFYGGSLNESNSSLRLNLQYVSELYGGLGLKKQSTGLLWMLIMKLARMGCLREINCYYNGGKNIDIERFMNFHFDYKLMDNDVELVLAPLNFNAALQSLEAKHATPRLIKPTQYTCRLFLRDNRVMLAINDLPYQVARVNAGSAVEKLLLKLERRPSSETLTALEFEPNRKDVNFSRMLDKYDYRWLKPMLPICESKVISIQNPIDLDISTLLTMLPDIAENYRHPIAAYLGVE